MTNGILGLVERVTALLDAVGVSWVLGGSLASSIVGEPRSTVDGDVAIVVPPGRENALVSRLAVDFIVPVNDARVALQSHTSFNLIDRDTMLKVDLFALGDDLLDRMQIQRRIPLDGIIAGPLWITSPEDQVLRKLRWYQDGGKVSERQFRDVLSILQVNPGTLDRRYLTETAQAAGLGDLLEQAFRAAEGSDSTGSRG